MDSLDIKAQVTGLQELRQRLNALPPKVQRRVQRSGMRKAATLLLKEARNTVKQMFGKKSGNLLKGLSSSKGIKFRKRRGNTITVKVGADYKISPHAHLLESGTVGRRHKSGKWVGRVAPTHFFRRTFDRIKPAMMQLMYRSINEAIDRENRKAGI